MTGTSGDQAIHMLLDEVLEIANEIRKNNQPVKGLSVDDIQTKLDVIGDYVQEWTAE